MNARTIYCCEIFKDLVQNLGTKGFAVVPLAGPTKRRFHLISQSGDFVGPGAGDLGANHRVITILQTGIAFCPSCGKKLSDWIAENTGEFDQAASEAIASGKYIPSKW